MNPVYGKAWRWGGDMWRKAWTRTTAAIRWAAEQPAVAFLMRNMRWLPSYVAMGVFLASGDIKHYTVAIALAMLPALASVREM